MAVRLAILRRPPVLARVGMKARTDRPGNHALAHPVAGHHAAKLLDHADRFMADGQARLDRILALEDVDIRAADGGGRDADQRIGRPHLWNRLFPEFDLSGPLEDQRLHACHDALPTVAADKQASRWDKDMPIRSRGICARVDRVQACCKV
ncbi:hypothetical protein D3C86_1346820 [compost metagenome]